ncbi:MAG: YdcF family protein [Thiobacillus sp.]
MLNWLLTNILATALLPPFSLVLLLVLALVLHRKRPRMAISLIFLVAFALYVLSTPWVGGILRKSLEVSNPIDLRAPPSADAIVVLGGGRRTQAREYGGDTLNSYSLERLRYAARLHRATQLPILATGGMPGGGSVSEGALMRKVAIEELHIPIRWVEAASLTTWDNARLSAPILKKSGVKRILLVTDAAHMRRAVPLFQQQGLDVIPAGTHFAGTQISSPLTLLPNASGLRDSNYALHEWVGIVWYRLRHLMEKTT